MLLRITALLHLPVALAWAELARRCGLPFPGWLGALGALGAFLLFPRRLRSLLNDRHRARWQLLLIEEPYFIHWCASFACALPITLACGLQVVYELVRGVPMHLPAAFALGAYLVAFAIAAYGVLVRRRWVTVRYLDIPISDLPKGFDGYRIAQLSDLHIGGFITEGLLAKWLRLTHAEAADLVVITGDLVTSGVAFHDDIASFVGKLRGRDGTVVSLGNHDYFGEGEPLVHKLRAQKGVTVLRNAAMNLMREGAQIRLAAVDDTWTGRADLLTTLAQSQPGVPTILLAHDPDLFDQAVGLGADLVLSGHTHGGQVAFPWLARHINLSKLAHRRTYGLYYKQGATLYVHGGLGTTGPPVRFGVPPEIVVCTLRRR